MAVGAFKELQRSHCKVVEFHPIMYRLQSTAAVRALKRFVHYRFPAHASKSMNLHSLGRHTLTANWPY
jgi:hypothetical protein